MPIATARASVADNLWQWEPAPFSRDSRVSRSYLGLVRMRFEHTLLGARFLAGLLCFVAASTLAVGPRVEHDVLHKQVTLSDAGQNLVLRLNYDGLCLLDRASVRGREVIRPETGVCSAIKLGGIWFTTRSDIPTPRVEATSNMVTVSGIRFGNGTMEVSETWHFMVQPESIVWRIDRVYPASGLVEDTYFPGWDFEEMSTWTGALLGHGGVAWAKLFDAPNSSYGVHNGKVTFWNKDRGACLRIVPESPSGSQIAVRFSRQPSGVFSFNYSLSDKELLTRHGLSRFAATARMSGSRLW